MIKWIIILAIVIIATVFVVRIIKVMLKAEKDSNKKDIASSSPETLETQSAEPEKFKAEDAAISTGSGTSNIVTDMSEREDDDFINAFYDNADTEFNDYSKYARKNRNPYPLPDDFDFEGDRSDEYIPDSPEFSYIPRRQQSKKKPIKKELSDMSTEMKVLMLSDIFDRKFFD
jgi:hypothetical protein